MYRNYTSTDVGRDTRLRKERATVVNRWLFGLMVLFGMLTGLDASAQVTVSGCTGAGNGSYATLSAAAAAIVAAQPGAVITIDISGDTTEPSGGAALVAGTWTSLTIQPSGGAARTISGAITAGNPLLSLNGSDNVTINGLNTGGNSLTISNTTASATSGTSTIRFQTDATNNTITNCTILGSSSSATGTNGGNIFFASGAVSTGNDGNTVSNCNLGPAGSNLPSKLIYFSGSSNTDPGTANSGITITNNNFFDYFGAAVSSAAIDVNSGTTNISITNNKFYQTATRTQTTGANHNAIRLNNTNGNSYTVTGNTIGFANASGTGIYSFVGVSSTSILIPIFVSVGTTTASNINNNTIAGIAMSGSMSGTSSLGSFRGIYIAGGLAICNGNTIGSLSSTGSITFTSNSSSAADVIGIFNFGSNNWTTNNNNVGGITASNSSTGAANIYGIRCNTGSTVTWTCNNNIVGGTVANSLSSTSTATGSMVNGILNSNPIGTFTSNTVRNLSAAGGTGTTTSASVIGICSTSSANQALSLNTIFNLSNSNTTAATVVTGIQFTGSTANTVSRNNIYNISTASNSASSEVNGIRIAGGTTTYANNMIALGNGIANAVQVNGINEPAGTDSFYHNSVYIGGTATAGTANSFAFNSTVTTNTRNFRNNIFSNARTNSGATGKNYAVQVGGTAANPAGLTINYNVYNASGTGGVFGRFNGADVTSIGTWKTAVGQDANSIAADPTFADASNTTTPDLHIHPTNPSPAEGSGIAIGTVTDDFDGQTRSGLTPTDIGADAGNFVAAPSMVYVSSTAVQQTANSCANDNRVPILRMEVVTSGALNPLTLTSLTINNNGTSNFADAQNYRIFYTGTSNVFNNSNPIIAASTAFSNTDTVITPSSTVTLSTGTNYFWLTYNINASVTGSSLDAEFTNVALSTGGGTPTVTAPAGAVSVFNLPTVTLSPSSATFCSPGGSPIALTASGASTYTWAGTGTPGLSATTGTSVTSSPTTATVITVTGTDGNGCVNTATSNITVAANPTGVTASATPASICSGGTSTLTATGIVSTLVNGYTFGTGTGASLDPMTGATTVIASATGSGGTGDDTPSGLLSLPFTFNFNGTNYTQYSISPDGFIRLGGTAASSQFTNSVVSTTNTPIIYPLWDDLCTGTNGNATVVTTGTAPNRVFKIQWFLVVPRNLTGTANSTFQLWMYEGSNKIEFRYGTVVAPGSGNGGASAGMTGGATNFQSITYSTNAASTATANDANTTAPSSGTLYSFTPVTPSFAWTAATNLVTPNSSTTATTALTATETFTVTASNGGCSAQAQTTVTIASGASITTDPVASTKCAGETASFTVAATGPSLTYQWRKGGVDIAIGGNASAGTATLTLTNVTVGDSGNYDVVVTSTCGSPVTSAAVSLTVNAVPAIAVVSGGGTFCSSATITATNGNDGTMYFQGITSNGTSTATTSSSESVTASGTYYFRARSVAGCWGSQGSAAVVIETAPSLTTTPVSICAGGTGSVAATSTCAVFTNTGTTFNRTFTAGDPTALRPATSIVQTSTCSFDASILRGYQLQQFQVSVSGSYTLDMTSTDDGMAYLYTGSFTPGTCGTWIQGDDDSGPGNDPQLIATLTAGVTYTLISTTYSLSSGNSTSAYSWTASTVPSGGQLLLANNGTIQWYTAASGGSSIGSGASFNPVGVVGSGLANTNTPGTTTFYAACSNATSCRTAVTFEVKPNYTITATAGANGTITPSGATTLCVGGSQAYTITPNPGYLILDVLVNGVSQGAIASYSFTNVTSNQTISATFVTACNNVALASATATLPTVCNATTTTLTYSGLSGTNASVTWTQNADGTGATYGTGTPSNPVGPGTYYAYATGDCGTPVSLQVVVSGVSCQPAQLANCGNIPVLTSVNSRIFVANTVTQATKYRFRVAVSTAPSTYFYAETTYPSFRLTDVVGLTPTYGTTYNVEIQNDFLISGNTVTSAYGTMCTVTTLAPTNITVQTNQCNQTLAAVNSKIYVNGVAGATSYSYRIAKQSAPNTYAYIDSPYSNFRLTNPQTSGNVAIEHNTVYLVAVSVTTSAGSSNYNGECQITTPAGPVTLLQPSQCGDDEIPYVIPTKSTKVYTADFVSGATYTFRLEQYNGATLLATKEITSPINYFDCNMFTGDNALLPNTKYNVYVAINYYGVGEFDRDCVIRTPAALKQEEMIREFKAVAYPNPFANNFMIDVKSSSESSVDLKVYDMIGRLIDQKVVSLSDLETTTIGDRYPSGVYNVVVSQENSVQTVRVVKR